MTTVMRHPLAAGKRAVCWLDVLLFTIFVVVALGLWGITERAVNKQSLEQKPVKETYELLANVPLRQAGLTAAQDELKVLQSKLSELRLDATRLATELDIRWRRPQTKLLPTYREQRAKLLVTETLVPAYEAQLPQKQKQLADAANAALVAKRTAELTFEKAAQDFEFATKGRVLMFGLAISAILALVIGIICAALRKRLGHGSPMHVLLPGGALIVLASIYYIAK